MGVPPMLFYRMGGTPMPLEMQQVRIQNDFRSWRDAARRLLDATVEPEEVVFEEGGLEHALLPGLFSGTACGARPGDLRRTETRPASGAAKRVPREFLDLARSVACHRDSRRWSLLYRLLWRITRAEPHLLQLVTDDDVHSAF